MVNGAHAAAPAARTLHLKLTARVIVPARAGQPEKTLTDIEIIESLTHAGEPTGRTGGYAVCSRSRGAVLTADLVIDTAEIVKVVVHFCPHCGHPTPP